jgi:hypothetical protein
MDEQLNSENQTALDATATDSVTFHEASGTYRTEFDSHTRLATEAVVWAVAAASDTDPLELPPLVSVLDSDSLDTLFDLSIWDPQGQDMTVQFRYAGHSVTVNGHGTVEVAPSNQGSP